MASKTLADKVLENFSTIKLKSSSVKVPKLKIKNEINGKKYPKSKSHEKIPVSSIINILIKSAIDKAKSDEKDKAKAEETEPAISLKEEEQVASGGYGAASKGYGGIPQSSYADYEKLFSYLGKFRSQSAYEDLGINDLGSMNKMLGGSNFSLIDKETMETGAKFVKYFKSPVVELDPSALVPIGGMSSAEWEQFKLWMKLDPVMYRLKTSTS